MITIKSAKQVEKMRASAKVTKGALELLEKHIKPGVTTAQLDKIAYDFIISQGAKPNFLNYNGFPGTICASINDEVVHGIPSKRAILKEGDIISIDVTRQSFFEGIKYVKHGAKLGDVSSAIQQYVESHGYSVVRDLVGHGIGRNLHEDPSVPNFGKAGHGVKLAAGMTIAIEPMVNAGDYHVAVLDDDWTVVTDDGSLSAHYENTVLITKDGCEILTL